MTNKITTTLYRYKTVNSCEYKNDGGASHYDTFNIPGENIDDLIGGIALEIINSEVVYHIYDVADESVFNHPSVIWWDKKVFENEATITKLPTKNGKTVNWRSRNRGGGVKHKNFDKNATKLYYPETERPVSTPKAKPKANQNTEPPGGIMGIFKPEDLKESK